MPATAAMIVVGSVGYDAEASVFFANLESWTNDPSYPDSVALQTRFCAGESWESVNRRMCDEAIAELNRCQRAGLAAQSTVWLVGGLTALPRRDRWSTLTVRVRWPTIESLRSRMAKRS